MTTFDESWSGKPRKIGALERIDHWHWTNSDRGYFFGEYTPNVGWSHSSTNGLISNLKKPANLRGTLQWQHKERAIREVAKLIRTNLAPVDLAESCFVPMPPSKTPSHPEYDDRIERIATLLGAKDVRQALYATRDREARHSSSNRRDPDELRDILAFDASLVAPQPRHVILLDDMLTTGCGFMVAQEKLRAAWPDSRITGLFVARRVLPRTDFDDIDWDL